MRKFLLGVLAIVLGILVYWRFFPPGPNPQHYAYLRTPRIVTLPNQNMLTVEVMGDPNQTAGEAIAALYKHYFALKRVTKDLRLVAPRARWPRPPETPRAEWLGVFGLPLPENVTSLPQSVGASTLQVKITAWEYGPVVEILHQGPYSEEGPVIVRLRQYVVEQGYALVGPQEEEYLKGPGLFGRGNPQKYLTIIRYRVAKLPAGEAKP
jgi:hypothetical protein